MTDTEPRRHRAATAEARAAAVARVAAEVLGPIGLELYDVSCPAGSVRILVDRPGGVDLEALERATRAVGPVLDRLEELPGPYTLEVSSPGLERPLRRSEHFAGAVGERVVVRVREPDGRTRRLRGRLAGAGEHGCDLDVDGERVPVRYDDVVEARTVFEWQATPRPAGGSRPGRAKRAKVGSA